MIPVSTLYDEYIDRRKLTEQKNPFEYIVPPPSRGSEQIFNAEKTALRLLLCNKKFHFFRYGKKSNSLFLVSKVLEKVFINFQDY